MATKTILLVDDMELLRQLNAQVLQSVGYQVLVADGAGEAFPCLVRKPQPNSNVFRKCRVARKECR